MHWQKILLHCHFVHHKSHPPCFVSFQSNWKKTAGQMQSGDVQMPSHHTAKKYENLERWWKRKCRHKNFRQLSVDMAVKFFDIKSFILDVWFAYHVLIREITVFQCQLCCVAVETTLIAFYYFFSSLSPFYYSEIASCLGHWSLTSCPPPI